MDRFRDRHTAAGVEDEWRDSWVIVNSLRIDSMLFHGVRIDQLFVIRLRELPRAEVDVPQEQVRTAYQLRDLL